MSNDTFIKKFFAINPLIEVMARTIYYANFKYLKKFVHLYRQSPYLNKKDKKKIISLDNKKIDLKKIFKIIGNKHIKKGDLVIFSSSYKSIKNSGFSPKQVLEMLLDLIGKNGTLAMSARPNFEINLNEYLSNKKDKKVYLYNVKKTKCNTGIIAQELLNMKKSIRSKHPINSMVAIGPLAKYLMKDNLVDNNSLAHGINSSWYKCAVKNAKILSIGVDLIESATLIHTVEDAFVEKWPIKNWYRNKNFTVKDGLFNKSFVLKERMPKWILHYADRTLCKDFSNEKILKSYNFYGVNVEYANSKKLLYFLKKRINKSYPYFYTNIDLLKFIN